MIKINTDKIKSIEFTDRFTGVQLVDFDASVTAAINQGIVDSLTDLNKLTVWANKPKIKARVRASRVALVARDNLKGWTQNRLIAGKFPSFKSRHPKQLKEASNE